mmetsp:Transcript_34641/g.88635  ORF Transcript_34641/g.88635 Transcript_34641/m.88635 type:complete len:203 (-) Transcript_34641:736-1344(-)
MKRLNTQWETVHVVGKPWWSAALHAAQGRRAQARRCRPREGRHGSMQLGGTRTGRRRLWHGVTRARNRPGVQLRQRGDVARSVLHGACRGRPVQGRHGQRGAGGGRGGIRGHVVVRHQPRARCVRRIHREHAQGTGCRSSREWIRVAVAGRKRGRSGMLVSEVFVGGGDRKRRRLGRARGVPHPGLDRLGVALVIGGAVAPG